MSVRALTTVSPVPATPGPKDPGGTARRASQWQEHGTTQRAGSRAVRAPGSG